MDEYSTQTLRDDRRRILGSIAKLLELRRGIADIDDLLRATQVQPNLDKCRGALGGAQVIMENVGNILRERDGTIQGLIRAAAQDTRDRQ